MNLHDVVAANLLDYRLRKQLGQAKVARVAGISAPYLHMLEKGIRRPGLELLEKLARTLGADPGDLVTHHPAALRRWHHAQAARAAARSRAAAPRPPAEGSEGRVAINVRRLRTEAGLRQRELAAAAGLSTAYVSMLERGRRSPPLPTVDRLAAALGVPPPSLLEDPATPRSPRPGARTHAARVTSTAPTRRPPRP